MRNAPSADDVIIEDPIAREIFESIRRRDTACARSARRGMFQITNIEITRPDNVNWSAVISSEKFRQIAGVDLLGLSRTFFEQK